MTFSFTSLYCVGELVQSSLRSVLGSCQCVNELSDFLPSLKPLPFPSAPSSSHCCCLLFILSLESSFPLPQSYWRWSKPMSQLGSSSSHPSSVWMVKDALLKLLWCSHDDDVVSLMLKRVQSNVQGDLVRCSTECAELLSCCGAQGAWLHYGSWKHCWYLRKIKYKLHLTTDKD